jgi:hypothetical protein
MSGFSVSGEAIDTTALLHRVFPRQGIDGVGVKCQSKALVEQAHY